MGSKHLCPFPTHSTRLCSYFPMAAFRDSPELTVPEKATTQVPMLFRKPGPKPHKHQRLSVLEWQGFEAGSSGHSLVTWDSIWFWLCILPLFHWCAGSPASLSVCTMHMPLFKQGIKLCARPSLHNSVSFPTPLKSDLDSFYLNVFPM